MPVGLRELAQAAAFALLITLSPPILIFGVLFYTELLSALLCLVAVRGLLVNHPLSQPEAATLGGAIGLLPLVHVRSSALVAALALLALYTLARQRQRRAAAMLAATVVAFAAARALLTHWLWGTWMTTPHMRLEAWPGAVATVSVAATRAAGLIADQEYGLLPYLPILALLPWG